MKEQGNNRRINFSTALSNKDDLYNLSVRKKAAAICVKLLKDLNRLELYYEKIKAEDKTIDSYIENNRQIKIICENILKIVNTKTKKPPLINELNFDNADIRLVICAQLTEIAEGIIGLSAIMSIRHIERELVYASEVILKQLINILPYKLNK